MGNCANCPGESELRTILEEYFAENLIEKVQFRQWVSTDRCDLEMLEKSSEEFIDLFCKLQHNKTAENFFERDG
ncbi:hypothetical protein JTE90_008283 [Oedothorax gibbosus]|uniref:Uncharacterized protein n=1 Tax=Oedothorax gibbosus TaxID=931172 RepID=A0AAV6UGY0_9ARAC|nr:hypothetical protein JTE90_008283 [Oedothorax gibbosus]